MFATFVPFCFALIFVSLTFTKLVHLSIHINTVPPTAFILYLPSLLLPDVLVIYLSRLALRRKNGVVAVTACALGCVLSFVLLGAASSQLGFYWETGNEVQWSDALTFASDKDGMKILLSGLSTVMIAGLIIVVVSWFAKWYLYRAAGTLATWIGTPLVYFWQVCRGSRARGRYHLQSANTSPDPYESSTDSDDDEDEETKEESFLVFGKKQGDASSQTTSLAIFTAVLVFLGLTTFLRPSTPYNMMSATLPLAMMEMFKSKPDMCAELLGGNRWPFPDLISESKWEYPYGQYKGWAPGSNNDYVRQYRDTRPEWLPETLPSGFLKWTPTNTTENETETLEQNNTCLGVAASGTFYNPVDDPLKITNLDNDILDVLQGPLGDGSVKIKHVALIMLESFREELFPLQYGSEYHKIIMKSYKDGKGYEESMEDKINARLAQLGPVAERITGKSGNFVKKDGSAFDPVPVPQWNDTTPEGFGGINVVGGFTTASLSFKSMAAIHCGAWSMPVDSFEESETQAYQPCIPQVLELFNQIKENKSTDDFLEQQWLPAFFQSITDGYDRQQKFDEKIGFKHIVTKDRLDDDADDSDDLEEINYFGYAETTLKSHVVDYIKQIQKENKRMFFSHFTSTTHHPWGVPNSFKKTEFLNTKDKMSWHEDFDNYFNAIRFTDAWLGELMQTFDDFGISNETLVVFVGDHGQAFKEDDSKTGTYENGHVSNFRVPITFRHPKIPRVQYNANATSLSILPTILDLLINTGSLNKKDTTAASDMIQDYEGQSLIRPYKSSHNGRRAWNFGIINGGGRMLSMTSADAPWRLVMPLDDKSEYRFTDLEFDPLELKPLEKWAIKGLADAVKSRFGDDASQWVVEAEAVGRWWGLERKRLWGYNPGDSSDEDD